MASISSTNVNEVLPGLEEFLRSMVNSTNLDVDHRQVATMYLDKLDQLSQLTNQQSSNIDDPSLMNTDIISDEESDDFTDEDEEQQQQLPRATSICEKQPDDSTKPQSTMGSNQWYIDLSKKDSFHSLTSPSSKEHHETCASITPKRSSISTTSSSSNILADGLLLTYDKNHNWIWRYYVLDNFDLICFPADKKSRLTTEERADNTSPPLWVSDITNAKVHTTVVDKIECLCLQIGLAEAIYVRPSDPNEINTWLKVFREAISSQKPKDNSKTRSNVKTLSRNARRMFAQFNRKKGQIVSHLLDQMANVTGVDDKARKHYELRGFLVISLDNSLFVTKYCTIIDGIFRIHKSRLSDHTDHQFDLNDCTLSFPEERTRDIQFALTDKQNVKIFIRGNNIYSMGRLLNTLAKYVEITGSSQSVFKSDQSSPSHLYSDLDLPSSIKSLSVNLTKNIYPSASQLYDERIVVSPARSSERNTTPIQQETIASNVVYDQPTFSDIVTTIDRNNNQISGPPRPRERSKNESSFPTSQSSINLSSYQTPSSSLPTDYYLPSTDSNPSQHHRHRPHPLPRRSSIDYANKFTNLPTKTPNERHISTQTYDTIPSSRRKSNRAQPIISKHLYDIPVIVERPTRFLVPPFERYDKSTCIMDEDEPTTYDNVPKSDGIGKFRFVIPFNHSSRSAFTTIKPSNSPTHSSSSTISSNSTLPRTSSSSNYSNANNNNNNNSNNRTRLMTAV